MAADHYWHTIHDGWFLLNELLVQSTKPEKKKKSFVKGEEEGGEVGEGRGREEEGWWCGCLKNDLAEPSASYLCL